MNTSFNKDYGIPDLEAYGAFQKNPTNGDLFLTTNFNFSLKRCPALTYFTQSISLSELGADPREVNYMISPVIKMPKAAAVFKNLTIKFLLDSEMTAYREIFEWMMEGTHYRNFDKIKPLYECYSEAFVIVTTNKKQPALKLTFRNIFPVELSGFEVKNTDTEASPITATVQLAISQTVIEEL